MFLCFWWEIYIKKKKRNGLFKLQPHNHVASCWRSQIRCHAPGISCQPSTGGDFSLPVWLCTEVGWDSFTKDAVAQLLNSHTCLRAVTSLIALEIPRRGHLGTSWRKEMPGAREGLCSLWKERCGNEGQHSQFTSHHGLAGEQDSLWNSLCKAQPGTGTNPLSKPQVSFSLFLPVYTISAMRYGKTSAALQ